MTLISKNSLALLIGINYVRSSYELHGCVNDINNIKNLLILQYGYTENNIIMLHDDIDDDSLKPTYDNIINNINKIVTNVVSNTNIVFYYSGHGCLSDEKSFNCEDELCSCDNKYLLADVLKKTLIDPLPSDCKGSTIGLNIKLQYIPPIFRIGVKP